jgi:hypothetical protein
VSNTLFYGDNLVVLRNREHFPDQSIDLIYLDPPFNSNASYNVLFKGPSGKGSGAQIEAFEVTHGIGVRRLRTPSIRPCNPAIWPLPTC